MCDSIPDEFKALVKEYLDAREDMFEKKARVYRSIMLKQIYESNELLDAISRERARDGNCRKHEEDECMREYRAAGEKDDAKEEDESENEEDESENEDEEETQSTESKNHYQYKYKYKYKYKNPHQ
eukprot:TRINITY_DN171_c1_g1_i11.p4 TRINITY_DN171_c1_g1~~TRINITY_DN171_c1_g1_i11.p4  ORF type:complete len:126 (-),score=21.97 TRINITY_DN171_c1_g1_i11:2231-2608(-)